VLFEEVEFFGELRKGYKNAYLSSFQSYACDIAYDKCTGTERWRSMFISIFYYGLPWFAFTYVPLHAFYFIIDAGIDVRKGKLPALGWNSWNAFGCNVDETKIMTAANQIVNLGLKDSGYEYVNSEYLFHLSTILRHAPELIMFSKLQSMTAGLSSPAETVLPIKSFRIPPSSRMVLMEPLPKSTP
jgi:hypothetical protein